MNLYEFLKDFAGPVATVVAAATAAWITFRFNSKQTSIAQSQAEIALDKLKVDVHKERYEIYSAAKSLIETMSKLYDLETTINPEIIRAFYVKIDEARFFFDSDIRELLDRLHQQCETIFEARAKMKAGKMDDVQWGKWGDALAKEEATLREMYAQMPSRFESALALQKLTKIS
jgi:hypothetical protein